MNTPFSTTSTTVTPTASDAGATITVNGNPVTSGNPSGSISLNVGNNTITTVVTAADTTTMKTYTINVIRAGNVTVSGSTGADGQYATLKDAFDALNANGTQAGNVIAVSIIGNTSETAAAVLNQPSVSSWTSLTITPSGARTVSGAIAGHLIDLNGADNVTIDGLDAAGNSLTIDNTSATTALDDSLHQRCVQQHGQNCTIKGSGTSTDVRHDILLDRDDDTGNNGNAITNNNITLFRRELPGQRDLFRGTSAAVDNSGTRFRVTTSRIISVPPWLRHGINVARRELGLDNHEQQIVPDRHADLHNRQYSQRHLHRRRLRLHHQRKYDRVRQLGWNGHDQHGSGTAVDAGRNFPEFLHSDGNGQRHPLYSDQLRLHGRRRASNIQGNTIAGFALYTSSGATTVNGIWCGINVLPVTPTSARPRRIPLARPAGTRLRSIPRLQPPAARSSASIATSTNTVNIQNNTMGAVDAVGTTATISGGFTGIDTAGAAGVFTINNNIIGNTTADNIRTGLHDEQATGGT